MTAAARARRAVGAAAAVVLATAAASLLAPSQSAQAATGRCAPGTGVTVVVDYGSLGGGVRAWCGAGPTAADVMASAPVPFDRVVNDPGFVCSITDKPEPATSCQRTPPSNAYWALFWSDGSSKTWTYSSAGVDGLKVSEGDSVGWRFQSGTRQAPGAAPTQSEQTAPAPSPRPSGSGSSAGGSGGSSGPRETGTGPAPALRTTPAATASSSASPAPPARESTGAAGRPDASPDDRRRSTERADRDRRQAERPPATERRHDTAETSDEATSADSELVQPVSRNDGDGGSDTGDVLLLVWAALAGTGLVGFGVVTARRRRT